MADEIKKVCTKCCVEKVLDDFYAKKKGLHGKHSECKECFDLRNRNRKKGNLSWTKLFIG